VALTLYHHPFTRAATVLWMLGEVGQDAELRFLDVKKGAHKQPDILALNPMGKLPILVDDGVVVTEVAAIGMYLADRYAPGRLAPALDDPRRGTYLRWSLFAPSVIEPAAMAHAAKWEVNVVAAGFGTYAAMVDTLEAAIGDGPWLLGDDFSMADVILGGTLRYMMRFNMIEARPTFSVYAERLAQRPALKAAEARNAAIVKEHGLG
jgi:glutathione S-transferase